MCLYLNEIINTIIFLLLNVSLKFIFILAFFSSLGTSSKNSDSINAPEQFLQNMNEKLRRNQFFGIETDYIFISLPIIDKAEMMNVLMRKIVKKSGEYQNGIHAV